MDSDEEEGEEGEEQHEAGDQAQLQAAQDQRGEDRQAGGGGQGGAPLQDRPYHQHHEAPEREEAEGERKPLQSEIL